MKVVASHAGGTTLTWQLNERLSFRLLERVEHHKLNAMFLFFSNRMGVAGSILISILLSVVLLYACSGL